jgi:hypothetical protein
MRPTRAISTIAFNAATSLAALAACAGAPRPDTTLPASGGAREPARPPKVGATVYRPTLVGSGSTLTAHCL